MLESSAARTATCGASAVATAVAIRVLRPPRGGRIRFFSNTVLPWVSFCLWRRPGKRLHWGRLLFKVGSACANQRSKAVQALQVKRIGQILVDRLPPIDV